MTPAWHELGDRRAVLLVQLAPDARAATTPGSTTSWRGCRQWMRVAVEFRHASWHDDAVFALLERHRAAYCVMSGAHLPCVLRATAAVRLRPPARSRHGPPLRRLLQRRRPALVGRRGSGSGRRHGRDVYAYFNNDGDGHAVRNASRLRSLIPG